MKPSIEQLIKALQDSWSVETCFNPEEWSSDNPARGQCVISSLVMQKYLGGDLLRYKVSGEGIDEIHFCNILSDGTIIDTTASQYKKPMTFQVEPADPKGFTTIRDKYLSKRETNLPYKLLLKRVESILANHE